METLKNHFYNNLGKNNEIVGLKVVTNEEEEYFINDFDQMCDIDKLPRWVLIGKKQGSNYGKMIQTNELFIK